MFTGFKFMKAVDLLSESGFVALKYFMVDSNIVVLVSSLIIVFYHFFNINSGIIPKWAFILIFIATVSVTLTFLVTLIFLAPNHDYDFLWFYSNSNLFFHFIVPILSFVSFCFF